MSGVGKIFELQLSKSVPEYALLHRLPDPAQSFSNVRGSRFSLKNPFDFILWDSKRRELYALEAKTVAGKSISFERTIDDKGVIHRHQIDGLLSWDKYNGITCGFIIEFRKMEITIFLDIKDLQSLINTIDKKSFNIKDLDTHNIPYFIIPQQIKRTRYTYDIDSFLSRK